MTCPAAYQDPYLSISREHTMHGTPCTRPADHRGDHQNWNEYSRIERIR